MYRSLNHLHALPGEDASTVDEVAVYRSLDGLDCSLAMEPPEPCAAPSAADSSWLQGKRPPLLRRQRACSNLFGPHGGAVYGQDMAL